MIILGKDDPWPEELRMDVAAGMRRSFPRNFKDVVVDGVCKWMTQSPSSSKPTHLIIGFHALQEMKSSLERVTMIRIPDDPNADNRYMGMKLLIADRCGIELLMDEPQ